MGIPRTTASTPTAVRIGSTPTTTWGRSSPTSSSSGPRSRCRRPGQAPGNNCYEIEQALPSGSWPECAIAYKVQESEAQLESFLAGLPAGQAVMMVWWQEPENDSFSGCPGATGSGANFVCYFEQQSNAIRHAAAADGVT